MNSMVDSIGRNVARIDVKESCEEENLSIVRTSAFLWPLWKCGEPAEGIKSSI